MQKIVVLKTLFLLWAFLSGGMCTNGQDSKVRGIVTNPAGDRMQGTNVINKRNKNSVTTDARGIFFIPAKVGDTLKISYVGYTTQEVTIKDTSTISIVLQMRQGLLNEVIVQAYGITTKRKNNSAISTLDIKDIASIPVASVNDAVTGRIAGVIVTSDNGAPGSKSQLSIRGGGTPLFIIDNVIRTQTDFENLNPNDIENYSVLKDASATALYGVSAANGVVLVATKKGQPNIAVVNYSFNYIFSQPTIYPKTLSAYENLKARNIVLISEGRAPLVTDEVLEAYRTGSEPFKYPNTDWHNLTTKKYATEIRHDLSFTAGNKLLTYYAALSYYDQHSILRTANKNNHNQRVTYRLNTTSDFDKTGLKVYTSFDGYQENNILPFQGYPLEFSRIQNTLPNQLAYNEFGLPSARTIDNPVVPLAEGSGYNKTQSRVFNGDVQLEYKPSFIKGFTLRANAAYNVNSLTNKVWTYLVPSYGDSSTIPIPYNPPSLTSLAGEGNNLTLQGYLLYDKKFGDHTIDFTGIYEQQQFHSTNLSGTRINYQLMFDQLIAGPTLDQMLDGSEAESARSAWLGRVSYNYKSKYFFDASVRFDGSDLFAPGKQWGTFYAFAGGYILSEEHFMNSLKTHHIVDYLKLRASYGKTGNSDNIQRFQYVNGYSIIPIAWVVNGVPLQGTSEQGVLPSTQFSWQTVKSRNLGFDWSTLNNRLTTSFDYYYTRTTGFVTADPRFAATLGIGLPPINYKEGAVRKEGFDFNITWEDHVSAFHYKAGLNATYFNTLTERTAADDGITIQNPYTRISGTNGNALSLGYYNSGYYGSNGDLMSGPRNISGVNVVAGDLRYLDANGDGKIDDDDKRRIGHMSFPQLYYGFTIDLDFKGFFFSAVIQGTGKRDRYLDSASQIAFNNLTYAFQLNYWTPSNTGALFPRAVSGANVNGNNNYERSDFWLLSSAYIRLKYLQLGYDFKPIVLPGTALKTLRVFISGTNLLTHSKSKQYFIDPESDPSNANYPIQRTFAVGLTIGF